MTDTPANEVVELGIRYSTEVNLLESAFSIPH